MASISRIARCAIVVSMAAAALAACGGGNMVSGDVGTAQTLMELGEAVNALQQETAVMQAQVDSLTGVVARQDTIIRQLAGMAGVPVPVQ